MIYATSNLNHPQKCNLAPEETAGVMNKKLQKKDDVVIKPADNRNAVVKWDRKLYIEEVYKLLDNSTNSLLLGKTTLLIHQKGISMGALPATDKLLINHQPKQPIFYLLPKIHKLNYPC